VRCAYFDADRCRSCTLLEVAYADQLAGKEQAVREALARHPAAAQVTWLPTVASAEAGFRNKAKMVATGTVDQPQLGILDPRGASYGGVDLRRCPLYSDAMHEVLDVLADFVTTARLTPYDVGARRGELKQVLVTESPDGEFLVRWVLRSTEAVPRIRKHLDALREREPRLRVVTVNLLPEHKAVSEGTVEEVLTEETTLPMRLPGVTLQLPPRSFFQTNTAVATALYGQVTDWVERAAPASVWDLYCGVGGFALHVAGPGREVLGVEVSEEAVAAARVAATDAGLDVAFRAGDATGAGGEAPDLVVVNPPRRGLGPELAAYLDAAASPWLVYSSCNAASLARDLAAMPSWVPREARLFDMFPHTAHHEVAVLLEHDA